MAEITAALVKDLREQTGAGMMDCKSALTETKGDVEAAIDWLRKKGLSKAAKKADRAAAEGLVAPARGDEPPRPVQQRRGAAQLRLHVHGLVAVHRVHDGRQVEPLRVRAREAGVAVRAPLHGRAHAVPVSEVEVVAHADLVAVVQERRPGQGEQQRVRQLQLGTGVVEQRRKAAAEWRKGASDERRV